MSLLNHDLFKKTKDSKFKSSPSLHAFVLENHDKSYENIDDGQHAVVDDFLANFCMQAEYRWKTASFNISWIVVSHPKKQQNCPVPRYHKKSFFLNHVQFFDEIFFRIFKKQFF